MSGKYVLLAGYPFPLSIEMHSSPDPGLTSFHIRAGSDRLVALVFVTYFKSPPKMVGVSTNCLVPSTTTMARVGNPKFQAKQLLRLYGSSFAKNHPALIELLYPRIDVESST